LNDTNAANEANVPAAPVDEEAGVGGALWIPLAKIWFVLSGFIVHFGLPNLLSSEDVGDYGVVNRSVSLVNMVMTTGALQAVARFVAADPSRSPAVRRTALRLVGGFGVVVALAWALAAPLLAELLNDASLTTLFRVTAPIPLAYGVYAVFVGVLNGRRRFRAQGILDMSYATMRSGAIVGAAALGYGALGSLTGFTVAAVIIALIAAVHGLRTTPRGEGAFPVPEIVAFALPVVFFVVVSNFALSADLFWVKRLAPADVSKLWTGAYFAILNLGLVPYMLVVSINFIVFPLISRAVFVGDHAVAAGYVRNSLRLGLLLALSVEAAFAASPEGVLSFVYPSKPEWQPLAGVMTPLALGYVALTLFHISTAMLNAAGRPRVSLLGALLLVGLQSAAVYYAFPRFGLMGAALGTTAAFLLGTAAIGWQTQRLLGAWLPWKTLLRGAVAAAVAFAIGHAIELRGLAFVLEAGACFAAFWLTLIALGELSTDDRATLRKILQRRRPRRS
jgi:O-antigen/teichoic acid export membrane protein